MRWSNRFWAFATALGMAVVAATVTTPGAAAARQTPTRSLVVVGDSIVLAAAEEIQQAMPADWYVHIDAEVGRPTHTGHDVVRANLAAITDTLVIGLGANDAASTEVFARRMEALLADVGHVPNVWWLEIAEVRDYYPAANALVRDAAARLPNLQIVPWNAAALADPGLTADDGLHLTSRGQVALAQAVVASVLAAPAPVDPVVIATFGDQAADPGFDLVARLSPTTRAVAQGAHRFRSVLPVYLRGLFG